MSSGGGKLVPLPPDGGWGWVVVLGSFFVHVFADGFVYSFGVLVETLMEVSFFSDILDPSHCPIVNNTAVTCVGSLALWTLDQPFVQCFT